MTESSRTNNSSDRILLYRCLTTAAERDDAALRLRNDFKELRVTGANVSPTISDIEIPLSSSGRQAAGSQTSVSGSTINIPFILAYGRYDDMIRGIMGDSVVAEFVHEKVPAVPGDIAAPGLQITRQRFSAALARPSLRIVQIKRANGSDSFSGLLPGMTVSLYDVNKALIVSARLSSKILIEDLSDRIDTDGEVFDYTFLTDITDDQLAAATRIRYENIRAGSSSYYFDFELRNQEAQGVTEGVDSAELFGDLAVVNSEVIRSRTGQVIRFTDGDYAFSGSCLLNTLTMNFNSGDPINCTLTGTGRFYSRNRSSTAVSNVNAALFGFEGAASNLDLAANSSVTDFRVSVADQTSVRTEEASVSEIDPSSITLSIDNSVESSADLNLGSGRSVPVLSSQVIDLNIGTRLSANNQFAMAVRNSDNLEISFKISDPAKGTILITLFNATIGAPEGADPGVDQILNETYNLSAIASPLYNSSFQIDLIPNWT